MVWGQPKPVLEYCEKSLENPALGIPGERDLLGGERVRMRAALLPCFGAGYLGDALPLRVAGRRRRG